MVLAVTYRLLEWWMAGGLADGEGVIRFFDGSGWRVHPGRAAAIAVAADGALWMVAHTEGGEDGAVQRWTGSEFADSGIVARRIKTDAAGTLRQSCNELGLEWDPAMLEWPKTREQIADPGRGRRPARSGLRAAAGASGDSTHRTRSGTPRKRASRFGCSAARMAACLRCRPTVRCSPPRPRRSWRCRRSEAAGMMRSPAPTRWCRCIVHSCCLLSAGEGLDASAEAACVDARRRRLRGFSHSLALALLAA
jgi:hypothetical protein